jgi:hypothetical protein
MIDHIVSSPMAHPSSTMYAGFLKELNRLIPGALYKLRQSRKFRPTHNTGITYTPPDCLVDDESALLLVDVIPPHEYTKKEDSYWTRCGLSPDTWPGIERVLGLPVFLLPNGICYYTYPLFLNRDLELLFCCSSTITNIKMAPSSSSSSSSSSNKL